MKTREQMAEEYRFNLWKNKGFDQTDAATAQMGYLAGYAEGEKRGYERAKQEEQETEDAIYEASKKLGW